MVTIFILDTCMAIFKKNIYTASSQSCRPIEKAAKHGCHANLNIFLGCSMCFAVTKISSFRCKALSIKASAVLVILALS